jgi:hypothetical protein
MSKPKPPTTLAEAGRSLWNAVVGNYDLRVDELAGLQSACKTADRIAMLEKAHADLGQPFLTRGSMGQDVIHPLIAEMRAQESHMSGLLVKLKLPDESGGAAVNAQRTGGATRWANAHGASA